MANKKSYPSIPPREQFLERQLPSNEDAERAVLGAVQMDNKLAHELFSFVAPEDFYSPLHRRIATAMQTIHKRAGVINGIFIAEEMKKAGENPDTFGGVATITNLTYGLPHFRSLMDYITVILEKSLARQTVNELHSTVSNLLEEDEEVDTVLSGLITKLIAMRERASAERYTDAKTVAAEVKKTFQEWERGNSGITSVSTGIPELDQRLRMKGLAFEELTMIAARPSIGKTALLLQICKHAAKLGVPTLFITLEMTSERLVMRMLPAITGIPNKSINPHTIQNMEAERKKLYAALETFDIPLYFDTQNQLEKLIANAENLIRTLGIKLVAVDYFGLISHSATGQDSFKDSFQKVGSLGATAKALKSLAVRNKIAALVAIQLSREIEKEYRQPRMSDVRDSGEIEAAADTMIFPHDKEARFHAQNPELIRDSLWLSLFCAKQRDGERDWSIPVEYNKDEQTFTSELMSGRSAPQAIVHIPAPVHRPFDAKMAQAEPDIIRGEDEPDF